MSQNKKSSTFCVLPMMSLERRHGIFKPCCLHNDPSWSSHTDIDAYWHSTDLQRLRDDLSSGIRSPGCKKCWQVEDLGQISLRQASNSDPERVYLSRKPVLSQVKLITGNTCNLACMMCFSTVSTTYADLWKTDKTWIMPDSKQTAMSYDIQMDQYIRNNADDLKYIEVLGGEPLFNKQFLDLARHLVSTGSSNHITLHLITNGTLLTPEMIKLFSHFKKTAFAVSVDGVGAVNEYQRWPSRWQEVENNLAKINDNFPMNILPTITALNIIRLPELVDYCHAHNFSMRNVNLLDHWFDLLPSNLPPTLAKKVSEEYRSYLEGPHSPLALKDFVSRWDKQRGIDITQYMPEWAEF